MTAILRRMPFFDKPTNIIAPGLRLRVKGHQIIAWVSVSTTGGREIGPGYPRFPAILDIGSNFTFSIRESQLRQRAGIEVTTLDRIRLIRHRGHHLPVYAVQLWVRRNQPGHRDVFSGQLPFKLELQSGIAVYPTDFADAPRLHLRVDAERRLVALRSPDWRAWTGRWVA